MTARTPPMFLAASSHPAEDVRRMMHAVFGGRGGIVAAGDLAVTQNGTPNMSVNVADGRLALPGSQATYQGIYFASNRGTTNVAIAAADSTNPRRDLIVARVRDAEYSGATNSFAIEVVTGTPAVSPVDPAVPANSWVLARVQVDAGVTSITNAAITDLRTSYSGQEAQAAALGGVIVAASTMPSSPHDGMVAYDKDINHLRVYDGSAWQVPYALGRLNHATRTSDTSNFTSIIYPLAVAATLLPNRRIRVHVHTNVSSAVANANVSVSVCNNAGTILNQAYRSVEANAGEQISVDYLTTSGAGGAATYQIGAFATASSKITASATAATYIAIYDEGPA